ncbi:methylenetetrahydrofolate reductase C-terminal domain-containing protein [Actinomycetospora endophytica]|uniref:Methylenetetrahydrofolate reductase C-terminal domain-containing protein n=1 Tax=Actinomycetospora endophytica TaxID=2291215 RepID=A0ABS8P0S1_9PSEU|nr:methylenetetrahydrofolate reductase C-terminal domain-containing protein [Actinomycetospora endophytica]MCD2191849.1 methylenetetrahydrofolate reductase C-terminal domain-containing protein [Actinomycetospora endophytica]
MLARRAPTQWLASVVERSPVLMRWFTAGERVSKRELFGCRMCGQCALPTTGYACPMTCPKELRNGPCGGVGADGRCEVHPEQPCVWVVAHERAVRAGHGDDLTRLQRPVDQRLWGQSSWLNYWQGRDEGMWTEPVEGGRDRGSSILRRELGLTPVGR